MTWWQHIPGYLDPIALTVGSFSVRWYALFFMVGFLAAAAFLLYRMPKLSDALLPVFFGALIGGRLGYAVFYAPEFFLEAPLRLVMPYDAELGWVGLSGMSFHGGLIGVTIALLVFAWRRREDFLPLVDGVALAAPIALFFGRIGNFFNLELYGRLTDRPWGMFFPGAWPPGVLRHPSALYEAILEGVLLFGLLYVYQKRSTRPGMVAAVFLIGYSVARFVAEMFREPDLGIGFLMFDLTLGQWLSLATGLVGAGVFLWLSRQIGGTMRKND